MTKARILANLISDNAELANESAEVQAICNAVHTDAVKDAYAAHLVSSTP